MELRDKTILITGASSGIGRAVALELGRHGNRLVVTARREDLLQTLKQEIEASGGSCISVPADAFDEQAAAGVVTRAVSEFGGIDAALLNVGAGPSIDLACCSADEIKHYMRLNYDTLVNSLVPLIQQMKQQGDGLIAHTNSLAGFLGLPMQGPYSAAKSAGRILMDACRIELGSAGIRFVSVHPGYVTTERITKSGVPTPFSISVDDSARRIIAAMEKEKADVLFPFPLSWLIRLAHALPKSISNRILAMARSGAR